mmetsp:Transcript_1079/g.2213  ORF Transcript_1079/g.2213 Transcript_1079/m.2213 type:complete len:476 (+) Transcript_1079:251-1678(+)
MTGRSSTLFHNHGRNIVVLGTCSQHVLRCVPSWAEFRLPSVVCFVEIAILKRGHVTIQTQYLDGRNIIALGTPNLHVRVGVLAWLKLQAPAVEVRATVHDGAALMTFLGVMYTLLLSRRLLLAARRTSAINLSRLCSLRAQPTALGPWPRCPLAPTVLSAGLAALWLLRCRAVLIVAACALHFTRTSATAARRRALAPLARTPFPRTKTRGSSASNQLIVSSWRQSWLLLITLRWLLAYHLALRLRTRLRLLALPVADRVRANSLALQTVVAQKTTLRLLTAGGALGGLTIQRLAALTNVLGAEHSTLRRVALHMAPGKLILPKFGAAGLAVGTVALGFAILLANGGGAVPCAVRHAADSILIRHKLSMWPFRCSRDVLLNTGVANDGCGLGDVSTRGRRSTLLRSGRIQVVLAVRQVHRNPDVPRFSGGLGSSGTATYVDVDRLSEGATSSSNSQKQTHSTGPTHAACCDVWRD